MTDAEDRLTRAAAEADALLGHAADDARDVVDLAADDARVVKGAADVALADQIERLERFGESMHRDRRSMRRTVVVGFVFIAIAIVVSLNSSDTASKAEEASVKATNAQTAVDSLRVEQGQATCARENELRELIKDGMTAEQVRWETTLRGLNLGPRDNETPAQTEARVRFTEALAHAREGFQRVIDSVKPVDCASVVPGPLDG